MDLNNTVTKQRNSGKYQSDREWSDRFIPEIKKLVAPHLIQVAEFEMDTKEATDLMVFKVRDMRIAARIRDVRYADRYGEQFTLRSKRDNGTQTELDKIQRGWGDWLFYGFGKADLTICPWYLIDLSALRYHLSKEGWQRRGIKMEERPNGDGTHFRAFWVFSFPDDPPLLIARSDAWSF